MLTALTIFTIITGAASLLGFAFVFFGKVTAKYKILCAVVFGLAAIWSGYVLLVPGSIFEKNVKKIYLNPAKQNEKLLIQSGSFALTGFGSISIEFPLPFRDPPVVEVINIKSYDPGVVPRVEKATADQVQIGFQHMRMMPEAGPSREFRWVARGIFLEEISFKK